MDKDEKENQPKTFAEKLNEHNKSCGAILNKASGLVSQASKIAKEGNHKGSEQLIKQAEKRLKLADEAMREFEINHEKELRALELYLKNNSE